MFEANIDLSFYIKLPKICQKQDKNQSLPSFCSMDSNHAQRIGRHFILRQICHRDFFLHRPSSAKSPSVSGANGLKLPSSGSPGSSPSSICSKPVMETRRV